MVNEKKIKFLLWDELTKAQDKNPSYSMRAFSKRVGVSQAAISQILSGKRPITNKTAERILLGLDMNQQEISNLVNADSDFTPLDIDNFNIVADWHYFAILSLAETEDFNSSVDWIANRLGLSIKIAEEAIAILIKIGLLNKNKETQRIEVTGKQIEALSNVPTLALKKASRQNLNLAQNCLDSTSFNERDFTAITLCFDPEKISEAKEMIKKFRRQFCRQMESYKKKEVYKLSIQLMPLTQQKE